MSDLVKFDFNGSQVRTVMKDGKAYFNANDVCQVLEYKNPQKAIAEHCRAKGVTKWGTPTAGGVQQANYLSEGNVFRLILRSKMEKAEEFQTLVEEEILPSIYHSGRYVSPTASSDQLNDLIKEVMGRLEAMTDRALKAEGQIEIYRRIAVGQRKVAEDWEALSQQGDISDRNGLPRLKKRRGSWVADKTGVKSLNPNLHPYLAFVRGYLDMIEEGAV